MDKCYQYNNYKTALCRGKGGGKEDKVKEEGGWDDESKGREERM